MRADPWPHLRHRRLDGGAHIERRYAGRVCSSLTGAICEGLHPLGFKSNDLLARQVIVLVLLVEEIDAELRAVEGPPLLEVHVPGVARGQHRPQKGLFLIASDVAAGEPDVPREAQEAVPPRELRSPIHAVRHAHFPILASCQHLIIEVRPPAPKFER